MRTRQTPLARRQNAVLNPAARIQDKTAADAAAAAANVSAVEDAAANKTDTASKTDTAKTEHKG